MENKFNYELDKKTGIENRYKEWLTVVEEIAKKYGVDIKTYIRIIEDRESIKKTSWAEYCEFSRHLLYGIKLRW